MILGAALGGEEGNVDGTPDGRSLDTSLGFNEGRLLGEADGYSKTVRVDGTTLDA